MATDFATPHRTMRPDASGSAAVQPITLADPGWSQALPQLADNSPTIIGIFRLPGFELLYLNKTGLRRIDPRGDSTSHELTLPEFFGLPSQALLTSEIIPRARVMGRWSGRCDMRDVWGSEFHVQAVLTSITGTGAYGACLCLQAVDLTLDRVAEKANFADRELLHALLDSLPDYVYFKDKLGRFLRVSRSLAELYGLADPRGAIGKTVFEFLGASEAAPFFAAEQQVINTGRPVIDHEFKSLARAGQSTWVSDSKLPLRDSDGKIVGTFGIARDITQRKHAEAERHEMETKLQLAHKLESIGRLAAGIAHEINTPTQFITDNLHFLTDAFAKIKRLQDGFAAARTPAFLAACPEAARAMTALETETELDYLRHEIPQTLTQSLEGLHRIARIVRSLKEFSHPNAPDLTPVDLNRAIETAITVSHHEWKYVAKIVTEFTAGLPPVPCILDEFNQVLLNLIVNAAQAIDEKSKSAGELQGLITIRTRLTEAFAVVEVEDNGPGIPEEHRARVFEPFFTTKVAGHGTGQGLAIVQNVIVVRHGGRVDFSTKLGTGTVFSLYLPLAARQPPANQPAPAPAAAG